MMQKHALCVRNSVNYKIIGRTLLYLQKGRVRGL